jgi:queuine/archaeosine tRNA-ribosyltransferase
VKDPPASFHDFTKVLRQNSRSIWLGQSVDTSILHASYEDFLSVPILTSVGCALRRPANRPKFDQHLRLRVGAGAQLMVDSGGFVLMRQPTLRWTSASVAALYRKIDADFLVSLDVPPQSRDDKVDRCHKYRKSFVNLERLYDSFGERIVPVVHGAVFGEVERNCADFRRIYRNPPLIGLGGLVPTLQLCGNARKPQADSPQALIAQAITIVRGYFPLSKLHIFGVGSLHTVLGVVTAGANSVDSIGWRQAAGFGSVFIPGRHRRLLTERQRDAPCRPFASCEDLEILAHCRCPVCREAKRYGDNIAILRGHFKPRAIHNIWVLYSEVAGYFLAKRKGHAQRYLSERLSDAWLSIL